MPARRRFVEDDDGGARAEFGVAGVADVKARNIGDEITRQYSSP